MSYDDGSAGGRACQPAAWRTRLMPSLSSSGQLGRGRGAADQGGQARRPAFRLGDRATFPRLPAGTRAPTPPSRSSSHNEAAASSKLSAISSFRPATSTAANGKGRNVQAQPEPLARQDRIALLLEDRPEHVAQAGSCSVSPATEITGPRRSEQAHHHR